jgi:hypothetical protein
MVDGRAASVTEVVAWAPVCCRLLAGPTRSPSAEQALRFFGSAGKVRLQQREFDRIMLRAAAANALVFGGERGKHLDRRRKIAALERREAA